MYKFCFEFIRNYEPEIVRECEKLEKAIAKENYTEAVIIAHNSIIEPLIDKIAEKEIDPIDLSFTKNYEKVRLLFDKNVIEERIYNDFNHIRRTRNKIAHGTINATLETALRIHRITYYILLWYYNTYSPDNILIEDNYSDFNPGDLLFYYKSKEYRMNPTEFPKDYEAGNNKISGESDKTIKPSENETQTEKPNKGNTDLNISGKTFQKLEGSYLLRELSKLKNSSHEAVENSETFSDFKEYLHIKREIQFELENKLKEIKDKPTSQLLLLCGNVGDGKSHLLAYIKNHKPELTENFIIHNDATESFDPTETAIDTLSKVLSDFNDENIDHSTNKLILAINLGVLNNFMESAYAENQYTKLKKLLDDTGIFEYQATNQSYDKDPVHILNFSDFSLFELKENGVDSDYLKNIFEKVFNKKMDNPFYRAYLKDVEDNYVGPIRYNYELLTNEECQYDIRQLLIKAIIKFKRIVSTREILNFIYEIIVPSKIVQYDKTYTFLDYIDDILPNLIYNNPNRSPLLKITALHDPVNIRNEILDEFLIKINTTDNLQDVLKEYLVECEETKSFIENMDLDNIDDLNKHEKIIDTIIRFSSLYGIPDIEKIYTREDYREFLSYLYSFNNNNPKGYKELYESVKTAAFGWKGSPKEDYIIINKLNNFNIAENIELSSEISEIAQNEEIAQNRFKNNITLKFKVNNNGFAELNMDYNMYVMIAKLKKGYKPNINDKEDLVIFNEFIEDIIKLGDSDKKILIEDVNNKKNYILELDEFGDYKIKIGD